ncbi:MAG: 16S rRNA (cytosine(1402)-N(4))-methyltransferase RsmH [Streptococcaceae bacterium]|jgi:16S rRNA (cytosine1402-N4)-methyltransferase|nr:16S rRNA (cytosine(1402)-N(4))-methyltransferase RsmH [Streptococcaceae bacterium]
MNFQHETVLLEETVAALKIQRSGIYVDATLGGAGHTRLLLSQLSPEGHLYSFDQDEVAISHAREHLHASNLTLVQDNFRHLKNALESYQVSEVDGILYDLGVSSPQFDDTQRGFSYKLEARLDMRMDQTQALSAFEVVNAYPWAELVKIFSRYGEEKYAKPIARAIEKARQVAPIETTTALSELIKSALPQKVLRQKGHPAKKIFQAIRIEVNDELGALAESLEAALELLKPGGRIAVITFHSLEDRLVQKIFKEHARIESPRGIPVATQAPFQLITKKPILPQENELTRNHRAHSAKLRVIEKRKL